MGVKQIKTGTTILILLMVIVLVGVSGCTEKKATNGTWGEKPAVTTDSLHLVNITAKHYGYNGTTYYYVKGYIQNTAENDATNVNVITTAYDALGKVFANNDTAYIKPTNIPATGQSVFYAIFEDPDNEIANYTVQVTVN
ncbi:MAG: FxLYD domain-containing protein [Methanobacterium paludis]|nr:FxLYD domain-containing protein [Methanobacterium paludis]